ncbi:hypothetical protein AMECASPLE_014838 [Ameca splendens]|uniref:Uncharacterized protein n=1 Tax=Ameca splendens TaxID=208324 RepID=A0ABV0YCR9_9TELE
MAKRTRSLIEVAQISFLCRVPGHSPRERVRSSDAAPPHQEESVEVAWASVSDASWTSPEVRCSRSIPPGGGPGDGTGYARRTMSLGILVNHLLIKKHTSFYLD